ncbi:MAG: hypothetical protein K8Q89_08390 [Nitrosarchaeum sp.]|nr:hypothetical protein [Nitrosarchaeum sp.]
MKKYIESDFDANDEENLSKLGKSILKYIEVFEKKSKIEGFIYLHGALEAQMFALWAIFLSNSLQHKFTPLQKFWGFSDSIDLLKQVNLIDQHLNSKLCAFKKGRDDVAHFMTNKFKLKQITEKSLVDQFQKGLDAYKDLIKIRNRIISNHHKISSFKIQIKSSGRPDMAIAKIIEDGKEYDFNTTSTSFVDVLSLSLMNEKNRSYVKNLFAQSELGEFEPKI